MASCGIAPEDDDGNAASKQKKQRMAESAVADFCTLISDSESFDALKKNFTTAYRAAEHIGDESAMTRFTAAKDERKIDLTNDIAAQA